MSVAARLVLFLLVPAAAAAFDGIVVDDTGAPIARAEVVVLGSASSVRTNAQGEFTWAPDPRTPFEVLVILPSGTYMSPVLIERIPVEGPLVVRVKPLVSELVTVTSGAAPNIDAPPGSATTSVPHEVIQKRHPTTLTDVIANIPGAGSLSDLHTSVPSLRGLARGRTLLLIDGARVTTERRAGPSATFLDPFFLESVEVARGPGSVGYGSDAFGGVINAITRRVAPGSPTRVRVRGALGAGLPEATAGVELTHGLDEGGIVVQARYRNFEEYRSPAGDVFNSQSSDTGVLTRFTHALGDGTMNVGWQSSFSRDKGRPDTRGEAVQTSYPEENSHRLTLSYDFEPLLGFTRLGVSGFWGRYQLITERLSFSENTLAVADVTADDFSVRAFGVRVVGRARWEVGIDVNGRLGLEAVDGLSLLDDDGDVVSEREEAFIEDARRNDTALYTSAEMLLGSRWTVGAGARVDVVTTRNLGGFFGDRSTDNASLSGYGSMKYELGRGVSATAQLAHGFRDPTLSDRYFFGISGRGVVTGNPDLAPERANQLDASLRYTSGSLRLALHGYYYRFSDLIERFETIDDTFFFRNRGQADIRGIEVELQSTVGAYALELSAQLARGDTRDDDRPVDDIPGPNMKLQLRREFAQTTYVQLGVATFVEDTRAGPTEIATPSYASVDVGAGYKLTPKVELRGLVRNVLDSRFPVSPDRRAVLAPGIHASVNVVAEF